MSTIEVKTLAALAFEPSQRAEQIAASIDQPSEAVTTALHDLRAYGLVNVQRDGETIRWTRD